MSTATDLVNRALSEHLGITKIDNIEGTDDISEKCKLAYDASRPSLLTRYDWKFAERRPSLALLSVEVEGFDYTYTYPADCLKIKRIYNASSEKYDFTTTTEITKTLHYISVDIEDAILVYTADVESVPLMPPLFQDALVLDMASKLAVSINKDKGLSQFLTTRFYTVFAEAQAADSSNEQATKVKGKSYTRVRG